MSKMIAPSQCNNAPTPPHESIFNYIITLAAILAYFPQFQRIITRNSSHGISPYFIFLSTTFTTSVLANILLLQSANGSYKCCEAGALHSSECLRTLAGTAQAGLQWLGSTILLTIYLIFYPRPPPPPPSSSSPPRHPKRRSLSKSSLALSPQRRRSLASLPYPRAAKLLALATVLLNALILIPTLSITFSPKTKTYAPASLVHDWAFFTATLALLAATTHLLPQLYTTLKLKHNAALSIVMLAVQCPVYIALGALKAGQSQKVPPQDERRGTWARWTRNGELVSMSYMVAGAVEGLLLGLCLYLVYVRGGLGGGEGMDGDDVEEGEEEYLTGVNASQETPLLLGRELRGAGRWTRESRGVGWGGMR